jgi:lipoprotein
MNRTNKVWMIFLLCLTLLLTSLCACEKPMQQAVDTKSGTNAELPESTEAADSDEPVKPDVTDSREWSKRY